jgi:hypothetical protein
MYKDQRRARCVALAIALVILSAPNDAAAATISVDIDERPVGTSPTFPGFNSFLIDAVGGNTAIQTGDITRSFGSLNVTLQNVGPTTAGYDDRVRALPTNGGAFTQADIFRDFVFSRQGVNQGLNLYVTGLVPYQTYTGSLWSYDNGSGGMRVSDWFANGVTIRNNYVFGGQTLPVTNDDYRIDFSFLASETGEVSIRGRRDSTSADTTVPPNPAASFGVFVNAFELTDAGSGLLVSDPVLQVDFGPGTTSLPGFSPMPLTANGSIIGGKTVTLSAIGGVNLDERNRTAPLNNGPFTHEALLQDFVFALTGAADTTGMEVRVDGLTPGQEYLATVWSYDTSSTGARGSNWIGDGAPVPYQFAGEAAPRNNEDYRFRLMATADANGTLFLRGLKSTTGVDNHAVFLNALELRTVIPEPSTVALAVGALVALAIKLRSRRGSK